MPLWRNYYGTVEANKKSGGHLYQGARSLAHIPGVATVEVPGHPTSGIIIPQITREVKPHHLRLAALLQQAHALAAGQPPAGFKPAGGSLAAVEAQVDVVAAELWGITDKELQEIRRSLEELG